MTEYGATPLGYSQPAKPKGRLPTKIAGKHRWAMIASYAVSAEALKRAHRNDVDEYSPILDTENLFHLAAGCIDCEEPWPAPEPCKGHYTGFDQ